MKDLSLALFVGLLVGAYSSIFFATPILTYLKQNEPKYKSIREKAQRDAGRAEGKVVAAGTETEAVTASTSAVGATTTQGRVSGATTSVSPTRARAGSKKAKRRKRR